MLIVDTGPLVAFLNRNDPDHDRCAELLESYDGDLLITPYVLTENRYLVGKYPGAEAEINLVESVHGGDLVQVCPEADDLARIATLMRLWLELAGGRQGVLWSVQLLTARKREVPWVRHEATASRSQ